MAFFSFSKTRFPRGKTLLCATVTLAVLSIGAFGYMVAVSQPSHDSSSQGKTQGVGGLATVERIADDSNAVLPFRIDGVGYQAPVVEVKEGAQELEPSDAWVFGGDYSEIASFPINRDEVFGSSTNDPADLRSYYPAMITSQSASALGSPEPNLIDGLYYEPQDGSGTASALVWRSALLDEGAYQGIDNWAIQYWSAGDGAVKTLGTALALNGMDTPHSFGEVVPTFNKKTAYFSSNIRKGDTWSTHVLSFDLNEANSTRVVAEGNYPVAVEDGAIFASGLRDLEKPGSYGVLSHYDGGGISEIFRVTDDADVWGVGGVWSSESYKAVCITSNDGELGSYVGFWQDDFSNALLWIHVKSATVIASMNDDWFVWGSGSQAENAGMYAYSWHSGKTLYLGSAAGYSRPAIAKEDNAVVVPFYEDEMSALSYKVFELPAN